MNKYLLLIFLSIPLIACAEDSADYSSTQIQGRINALITNKGNLAERQYWRTLLKWSDECESDFQGPLELRDTQDPEMASGLKVYAGPNKQYVIRVTCTLGAYQGYQQFYHLSLADNSAIAKVLKLPIFDMETRKINTILSVDVWGNVLKNSTYTALTILNRYSGHGHCGTLTTYQLINGEVSATRLLAQPDCEAENASRDPEKWQEYPVPR